MPTMRSMIGFAPSHSVNDHHDCDDDRQDGAYTTNFHKTYVQHLTFIV